MELTLLHFPSNQTRLFEKKWQGEMETKKKLLGSGSQWCQHRDGRKGQQNGSDYEQGNPRERERERERERISII